MSFPTTFPKNQTRGARNEQRTKKTRWNPRRMSCPTTFLAECRGERRRSFLRALSRATRHFRRSKVVPHDFHTAILINIRLSVGFRDRFYVAFNFKIRIGFSPFFFTPRTSPHVFRLDFNFCLMFIVISSLNYLLFNSLMFSFHCNKLIWFRLWFSYSVNCLIEILFA